MVKVENLKLVPINGTTVRLTGAVNSLHAELGPNKEIIRLYREDGWEIKIGDTIRPRPSSPYKVNHILIAQAKGRIHSYELKVSFHNSSSIFVLPFLGGNRQLYMWNTQFVNCFVGTTKKDAGQVIALLYRFKGDTLFLKFESALCAFRNFKYRYDPDPNHVMFVFDIPEEAQASFGHYMDGRYSQIDDLWKLKILDFHGFNIEGHTGKIMFQANSLRKSIEEKLDVELDPGCELHSRPDLRKEVFDPEYYIPAPKVL